MIDENLKAKLGKNNHRKTLQKPYKKTKIICRNFAFKGILLIFKNQLCAKLKSINQRIFELKTHFFVNCLIEKVEFLNNLLLSLLVFSP